MWSGELSLGQNNSTRNVTRMILLEITIKVNLGLLIPCVRRWTHSQRDDNRRVLNCCILIVRIDSQIDFKAFLFVWNVCSLNRLFVRPTEQVLLLLPPFIIHWLCRIFSTCVSVQYKSFHASSSWLIILIRRRIWRYDTQPSSRVCFT